MNKQGHTRARLQSIGDILAVAGYRPTKPLFVIGTGRCGSSLLMEILASHPQLVVFPDEANDLWHPNSYPFVGSAADGPSIIEDPHKFTEISLSTWPPGHDLRIRSVLSAYNFVRGVRRKLVLKSAMISFLVPRILAIFPQACFCHIYRNGPPVVESLVKKEWTKSADRFRSVDDFRIACARYWNDCILEIDRQESALQLGARNLLLEVGYEALCADPPSAFTRLASFLGVEPDGFAFRPDEIRSQDYKVGDYTTDPIWRVPLEIMAEGMRLKGFPVSG